MRSRFRLDTLAAAAAALLAFALFPRPAAADHSVGQSCYACHKLGSASIYKGTRAIDKTKSIGLNPTATVTQPLNCEFCHTDYTAQFNDTVESSHPVTHINGSAFWVNGAGTYQLASSYAGVKLICKDCHAGNTQGGNPNPDVAPSAYTQGGKDNLDDGYPNHQLSGTANNVVVPFVNAWATYAAGDDPHPSAVYNHQASSAPATDYALCLGCHNATGKTTNEVNVSLAYTTGAGHYFKSTPTVRIVCSDCHDTHGSSSIKLYNRAAAPITTDNERAICLDCHQTPAISRLFTDTTANATRNITVPSPPSNVAAHTGGTSSCIPCHDPHDPSGGRTDCFDCHSTNTTQAYKDALGGSFTKYVDDGVGDDIAYTGTSSNHTFTFADGNSAACLDCHVIVAGKHANGSTYDDLKYNGPNSFNWPVSTVSDASNSFGAGIEFCLGCHRGGTNYWTLTPPAVNTFVDFGADGKSSTGGDNVTNNYGQGDTTVTGYTSNAPPIYDSATGAGHDPPSGYTGVPMFAHYTQGATSGGTKWWQLGSTSAPQPLPCMDCHNAHGAPNEVLYRSPRSTPTTGIAKGSRNICQDCHATNVTVEGRDALDPTTAPTNDRYGNPVIHHNSTSTQSCSSTNGQCHNPHTPSCEVCHSYPP